MSLSAFVSSSLPFENGGYTATGLQPIPVEIIVYNSSSNPVTLKTIYLTQEEDALGTGASLSLGDPNFRRNGVSYAPANNVVPAAVTEEVSGSIPVPSGSGDQSVWMAMPFQDTFVIGSPPLELGPFYRNLGYWGVIYPDPVQPAPVAATSNNSFITGNFATPIFSGALNLTNSIKSVPSVYVYGNPEYPQGAIPFIQGGPFEPQPPGSLCNEFTYEWWSYLYGYGVPVSPFSVLASPTNAGTVISSFGLVGLEGFGATIGYTEGGKLYCLLDEDMSRNPIPSGELNEPPYVGLTSSATVPLNTWTHQAVTRNAAGQVTFWINGTASGGGTRAIAQNPHYFFFGSLLGDPSSSPFYVPDGSGYTGPWTDYIENICDGLFINLVFSPYTKYTGNFTPPTGSLTASYGSGGGSSPVTGTLTTLGSASFSALFQPQIDPLQYLTPNSFSYDFPLTAVVMRGDNPNITRATSSLFRVTGIGDIPGSVVTINNPFAVWSLADNRRPPQNDGFDFQLTPQIFFGNTGQILEIPQALCFYSSSDTGVVQVVENSDGFDATTGSVGGFTQLSASGGSVTIAGTGSATVYFAIGAPPVVPGNYQGETTISVVDALPVSIQLNPPLRNVFSGSSYPYTATLIKSNGSTQDITTTATWSTTGAEATITPVGATQELGITGSFGTINITAVSGGLNATAQATIISRNF